MSPALGPSTGTFHGAAHLPHVPAVALAVAALAACASAPEKAAVAVPTAFVSAAAQAGASAPAAESTWWRAFTDPVLDELVMAAADTNYDVRIAVARVDQARAGVGGTTARLLPSINAAGSANRQDSGYDEAVRQRLPDLLIERAALDVSWEIDLFGASRSARRAAQADALAAEHARRGAVLSAVAETARQYFTLRGAQDQREVVRSIAASQRETLRLTQLRRAAGQASELDVDRASADLATTEAAIPRLDTLIEVTRFRIATLTGSPPAAEDPLVTGPPVPLATPLPAPHAQPAELLTRRPDVMAAEAQLVAAGYRRHEARAARFPRLFASALFGRQWTEINARDVGAARFANAGAALALPLFAGGRIEASIDAANAREREALAAYEKSILQALEEVEGALTALSHDARRAGDLERAVQARETALVRARSLYRAGQADLLQVLDVERGLLAARLERSANQTARLTGLVLLYRALGGGWQAFDVPRPSGNEAAPVAASNSETRN